MKRAFELIRFVAKRMIISIRHVPITVEYPYVTKAWVPLARTRLRNYVPDCIGCYQCAEICPVDAIAIDTEAIPEGHQPTTTKGVPFQNLLTGYRVDYSRCISCGLCVSVCPTSCLTFDKTPMTPEARFADLNIDLIHTPRSMRRNEDG